MQKKKKEKEKKISLHCSASDPSGMKRVWNHNIRYYAQAHTRRARIASLVWHVCLVKHRENKTTTI